jgi:hypothetical protein
MGGFSIPNPGISQKVLNHTSSPVHQRTLANLKVDMKHDSGRGAMQKILRKQ